MEAHLKASLIIALGGMLGANARYFVGVFFLERFGVAFPYGTLFINVSGSLLVGLIATFLGERLDVSLTWRLFFITGFLGAYTTFSTYSYEGVALFRDGAYVAGIIYVVGSVVGGIAGGLVGIALAERL